METLRRESHPTPLLHPVERASSFSLVSRGRNKKGTDSSWDGCGRRNFGCRENKEGVLDVKVYVPLPPRLFLYLKTRYVEGKPKGVEVVSTTLGENPSATVTSRVGVSTHNCNLFGSTWPQASMNLLLTTKRKPLTLHARLVVVSTEGARHKVWCTEHRVMVSLIITNNNTERVRVTFRWKNISSTRLFTEQTTQFPRLRKKKKGLLEDPDLPEPQVTMTNCVEVPVIWGVTSDLMFTRDSATRYSPTPEETPDADDF